MALRFSAAEGLRRAPRGRSGGFSLLEILVASVISALVLAIAVRTLLSLIRTESANQQELNRKNTVGRVFGMMQEEIRNATRVQIGGSTLSGCSTTPLLTLYGATSAETITYGLRAITSSSDPGWQGPNVLMRCGPQYTFLQVPGPTTGSLITTSTPILDSSTRVEQEVVDSIPANGFAPALLGGTGAISRSVRLSLASNISGGRFLAGSPTTITSLLQVPISTNQIYGQAGSGATTCPGGGDVRYGCPSADGDSNHWKPSFGDTVEGDYSQEDVIYFDGRQSTYTITGASGRCVNADAAQTANDCRVQLKADPSQKVTIYSADVLVFSDGEIRVPPP